MYRCINILDLCDLDYKIGGWESRLEHVRPDSKLRILSSRIQLNWIRLKRLLIQTSNLFRSHHRRLVQWTTQKSKRNVGITSIISATIVSRCWTFLSTFLKRLPLQCSSHHFIVFVRFSLFRFHGYLCPLLSSWTVLLSRCLDDFTRQIHGFPRWIR